MQNTLLQSWTGVAQLKKERRQEDDSVNRHKLRRKGKRRAADSRGADWTHTCERTHDDPDPFIVYPWLQRDPLVLQCHGSTPQL